MTKVLLRLLCSAAALVVIVILGVNLHMSQDVEIGQSPDGEARYRYFAYGSNMSLEYFGNIRGVKPLAWNAGTLQGYQLVFDIKGPNFIEPAFANIRVKDGARVEGVVYELSAEDYAKTLGSESRYRVIDVELKTAGTSVIAKTLIADAEKKASPSKRYHQRIIDGAIENDLSQSYIQELRDHDSVYFPIASEIMGTLVHLFVMFKASKSSGKILHEK